MSWSLDLRERVVSYIEGGGKKSKASELFKISRPTIDSWLLRKKEKGNLNPNDYIRESKTDNEKLISFVEKNSNFTQKEYASVFNLTQSGICRAFKRLKITRKKNLIFIKKEMKKNEKNF